jgi:hypothetical protein
MNWHKEPPKQNGWYFWRRNATHGIEHWRQVLVSLAYVGYVTDIPNGGWWLGPVEEWVPSPVNPYGRLK